MYHWFETTNKYVDAICDFNLKPWDNIKLGDNIPQEHDQASVMRGGGIVSSVSPALLLESESEWLSSGCDDAEEGRQPLVAGCGTNQRVTPSAATTQDQIWHLSSDSGNNLAHSQWRSFVLYTKSDGQLIKITFCNK